LLKQLHALSGQLKEVISIASEQFFKKFPVGVLYTFANRIYNLKAGHVLERLGAIIQFGFLIIAKLAAE